MDRTFVFGDGHVFIGNIEIEGQSGIVISHSEEAHKIGDKNPEWADKLTKYYPKETDVLLMASSIEGARVLQDIVNAMCLSMTGYSIDEAPKKEEVTE